MADADESPNKTRSPVNSGLFRRVSGSPNKPSHSRPVSIPTESSPNFSAASDSLPMLRSAGVDFVFEGGEQPINGHPSSAGKLFSKLSRKPRKGHEKTRSLLPAFTNRHRSDSCTASEESLDASASAPVSEAQTVPRPVITRPKIVRRASSVGDLSSGSLPASPTMNIRSNRSTLTGPLLDTPSPSHRHSRGTVKPSASLTLRNRIRTQSHRPEGSSESSNSSSSSDRKFLVARPTRALSPHNQSALRRPEDAASLTLGPMLPAVDLNLAEENTFTIKSNSPIDFEWRCVSTSGQGLRYELVIRKADEGRTPISASAAKFLSTPTLSSPSPASSYPSSPLVHTPEVAPAQPPSSITPRRDRDRPLFREDKFWSSHRRESPTVADLSSDDEEMSPLTPTKRYGGFQTYHIPGLLDAHDDRPHEPPIKRQQPVQVVQPEDEDSASSWHEYDGFLNIFAKPPPLSPSTIAERRGAALLQLTSSPGSGHNEPTSRWSETEDDNDSSSMFSIDSL